MVRKLVSVILAVILAVSICGCRNGVKDAAGSKAEKDSASASDGALELYDEKEIGCNSGLEFPANARINSKNRLVIFDNAGKFVTLNEEGKPESEILCHLPGQMATFDLDSSDNIWAVVRESASESEMSQKVCAIDSSGKITETFELGKLKTGGVPGTMPIVMDMAVDANGNIYLATLSGIIILDKTGRVVKKIGTDAYYSIDTDPDNNIITVCFDKGKQVIEKIDSSTWKNIWSSNPNMDTSGESGAITYSAYGQKIRYNSAGKSIYLMNDNGVENYDNDGKLTGSILDFRKYLILASGNMVSDLNIDQNGNIYITTMKEMKYEIFRYDIQAGTHRVKERKTITLAVPVVERWLEVAALKFQKVNPEYKIDLKAYEQNYNMHGDYENYTKVLNTELLTGKGPDIIAASGLSYEKYIEKNMLADLSELIAQDKEFDTGKYYTNIFDALKYKDRLYTLPVSISFDILAVNKKILEKEAVEIDDARWTWKDFRETGEKLMGKDAGGKKARSVFISVSCQTLLDYMLKGNYGSFVNEREKKASFDSREFTDLLELVKNFGDSKTPGDVIVSNAFYGDMDAIEKGTVVFNPQTLMDYTTYAFLRALYNDQIRLLNFPSTDMEKGGVFNSSSLFSINNNSGNKAAAWEFLRFLLSDEIQSEELNGFAINKESLVKTAKKAVDMTNSGGMSYAIAAKGQKPKVIIPRPLTQGDIDYVNAFIENMRIYNRNNAGVKKVVNEETAAFFSGEKSVEAVAKLIQEKVNIYLGE
jgi:ABC-type glycerol-3-phosphate transport system substrate-binding protein